MNTSFSQGSTTPAIDCLRDWNISIAYSHIWRGIDYTESEAEAPSLTVFGKGLVAHVPERGQLKQYLSSVNIQVVTSPRCCLSDRTQTKRPSCVPDVYPQNNSKTPQAWLHVTCRCLIMHHGCFIAAHSGIKSQRHSRHSGLQVTNTTSAETFHDGGPTP